MLVILSSLVALASAPLTATDAPKAPPTLEKAEPQKTPQTCTKKVRRLLGHDVTYSRCVSAKPAPEKPASEPT
jgi:hypothetical protein